MTQQQKTFYLPQIICTKDVRIRKLLRHLFFLYSFHQKVKQDLFNIHNMKVFQSILLHFSWSADKTIQLLDKTANLLQRQFKMHLIASMLLNTFRTNGKGVFWFDFLTFVLIFREYIYMFSTFLMFRKRMIYRYPKSELP